MRAIQRRARGGDPDLCWSCYDRKRRSGQLQPVHGQRERECGGCSRTRKITYLATDAHPDLCATCFRRLVRTGALPERARVCGICGRPGLIVQRATDGRPEVCERCWKRAVDTCAVCGRQRPCSHAGTELAICEPCAAARRLRRCLDCGELRRVARRIEGAALCSRCWWRRHAARIQCRVCGEVRRPAFVADPGDVCEECARAKIAPDCVRCGATGRNYTRGLCAACTLNDRIDALIAAARGESAIELRPFLEALRNGAEPRSVLIWMTISGGYQTLRELLDGSLPLQHEALDQLDRGSTTEWLRAALVRHGALPWRDERLTALHRTIQRELDRLDGHPDRARLRRFAIWEVSNNLHYRAGRGRLTPHSHKVAQTTVLQAGALLRWLQERGLRLADTRQHHLDAFLAQGPTTRRIIRTFIRWAQRGGLVGELEVPSAGVKSTPSPVANEERIAIVKRLLADERLDLRDRVAGSLVLLLAQRLIHIVQLTTEHVSYSAEGELLVRFGSTPIPLPPPLARLVERLVSEQPGLATTAAARDKWLFPGMRAGQPLTPGALARRLTKLGIPAKPAQASALRPLLQEVPAPVLADTLGYALTTMTRGANTYAASFGAYIAAQSRSRVADRSP